MKYKCHFANQHQKLDYISNAQPNTYSYRHPVSLLYDNFMSFGFDALYRVSQHVWDRLNAIFWSSEVCQRRLRILRKNVFCSIKLLFEPFLWTAKMKMEFLGNFSPIIICSNLFSKLSEIGDKAAIKSIIILTVYIKGSKRYFLEQNTIFL